MVYYPYMIPVNHEYIHHKKPHVGALVREVVFGMEDGMVSTLGALTGIATGSNNHFFVVLSGFVIISVESISMAVGSYLSSKSERAIDERKLHEERMELKQYPEEEREELVGMYVKDGWPKTLAEEMALEASKNKKLFLQEMAYRELKIVPEKMERPLQNAVAMGISYVVGGVIPLLAYFFLPLETAIVYSIVVTLVGLFILGVATTTFSHRVWWQAGLEMLFLAAAAAGIGYGVGRVVDIYWLH